MGKPLIDMVGRVYGQWTVMSRAEAPANKTGAFWRCMCGCGVSKIVRGVDIRNGKSKSCGCLKSSAEVRSAISVARKLATGTARERFNSRYKVADNGCWEWTAHRDADGYGMLFENSRAVRAHRFSIQYLKGLDPADKVVCHSCDNPGCVNPEHLFLGDPVDNVRDMISKGRDKIQGERNNRARLSWGDVETIRNSSESSSVLAVRFGVSLTSIKNVRSGKTWCR